MMGGKIKIYEKLVLDLLCLKCVKIEGYDKWLIGAKKRFDGNHREEQQG